MYTWQAPYPMSFILPYLSLCNTENTTSSLSTETALELLSLSAPCEPLEMPHLIFTYTVHVSSKNPSTDDYIVIIYVNKLKWPNQTSRGFSRGLSRACYTRASMTTMFTDSKTRRVEKLCSRKHFETVLTAGCVARFVLALQRLKQDD